MQGKIFSLIIILISALLIGICYAAEWKTVTTITGASTQTTDYFNVPTNEWRITWSYTPSAAGGDYAVLGLVTYPKGETVNYVDFLMKNGRAETSGTTYIHQGIKDYYMKITSGNIDSYNIKIEYDSQAIPELSTIAVILALVLVTGTILVMRKRLFKQKWGEGEK